MHKHFLKWPLLPDSTSSLNVNHHGSASQAFVTMQGKDNEEETRVVASRSLKAILLERVVTHRMFKPVVLECGAHLLVHDHILQVLQGGMLADLLLKGQHVLPHRAYGERPDESGRASAHSTVSGCSEKDTTTS